MISLYKGRTLDPQRPIRVYRNLNGGNWSLWQDGLVRAHADTLRLDTCTFKVSKAGWERSKRECRRNVHAFVEGWMDPWEYDDAGRLIAARYNRDAGYFETVDHRKLRYADYVALDQTGMKVSRP